MKTTTLVSLATTLAAHAAVSVDLPGSVEHGTWENLNSTSFGAPDHPDSYFAAGDPWNAAISANGAGSTSDATFIKESGGGYFASSSIYDAGSAGVFSITDPTAMAGLETVVFQIDAGASIGVAPTLSYNGGSQALAATSAFTATGDYTASGPEGSSATTNFVWQWDLGGAGEAINSYEITWGSNTGDHLSQYELNLTGGDSYAQVVPEPSASALTILAGAGLLLLRRVRA